MQYLNGHLVVSATDLVEYLACEHLTAQQLAVASGLLSPPDHTDPLLDLLSRRGSAHERHYLDTLRNDGQTIVEIVPSAGSLDGLRTTHDATMQAMRQGVDVVYQAALFDGRWLGYADFLRRVDGPSELGSFHYEVVDAKLARGVRTAALIQLCSYADLLAPLQGREPAQIHVVLGDLTHRSFRLRDYSAYYRAVRQRFEAAVLGAVSTTTTYPEPVEYCTICDWQGVCESQRRADDHLSLVANIRRDQVRRLVSAGVTTVSGLAKIETEQVDGLGRATFQRLRAQAELQVRHRESGEVHYELLPPEQGRGLAALPPPSPGDLFFDMEGDPFVENGGLEYLFGVVEVVGGEPRYHSFWAHDQAEERRAFEAFVDFVLERLAHDPELHVYHYAPYEATALKRLMGRHATREAEIDQLLRAGVLIDLYQVVRQGLRVSQESYSIKQLEPLYLAKRQDDITDAGSSIVAYEQWLEHGDERRLAEIEAYNRTDCVSTWKLRDWLTARRVEAAAKFGEPMSAPVPPSATPSEQQVEAEARVAELSTALTAGLSDEPAQRSAAQQARWLLAQLLAWHRREAKPAWWAYFARRAMSAEELLDDTEALGGLEYLGVVGQIRQSLVHRYRFDPAQEYRLLAGDTPHDPETGTAAGTVERIDGIAGLVELRRSVRSAAPHPRALIPPTPINTLVLRQAIERLASWVIAHDLDAPGPYRAARDLLQRGLPRLKGRATGEPLAQPGEDGLTAACRLVLELDDSYLAIQGPPGAGKTYAGARLITTLVRAGQRVGVTANSHRAIGNLLEAVCAHAVETNLPLRVLQKAGPDEQCRLALVEATNDNRVVEQRVAAGTVDLVAGTPWLFARSALAEQFDVVVVDEAGQLSLANTLAVAVAARNLVLLGDPCQLAQPSTGSHPPSAELSALEHLLDGARTIPPERGLLLDTTWRLHPSICAFISEVTYEDRLQAHPSCAVQALEPGEPLGGVGLRSAPVEHLGYRVVCDPEAALVAQLVGGLLGRDWTGPDGAVRPLQLDDILVVAPYNAQVACLAAHLPAGARIGTVDRFQGQEAPVVVFSTATSTADDLPRGLDFLFSLNRLNVAISRARGLAVMVGSPRLLQVPSRTPEQMRLVNAFCRFVELAGVPLVVGPLTEDQQGRWQPV